MRKREKFIGLWLNEKEYSHLLKQCSLSGLSTLCEKKLPSSKGIKNSSVS